MLVYDPAKAGIDAGTLCGEKPTGIAATTDPAVIRELAADCVLYMARAFDVDDVVALLESGTNVITTRGELFDAGRKLSDARPRSASSMLAVVGSSSIFATGSSPGFITDALPMALLSLSRMSSRSRSRSSLTSRAAIRLTCSLNRWVSAPRSNPFTAICARRICRESSVHRLRALGEAAGLAIDQWESHGEAAGARRTTTIAAGELPAGTVAAQRTSIVGSIDGVERMRFSVNWYCTEDVDPDWDLRPTGWRVRMQGDVPMDVELAFQVPLEEMGAVSPSFTANRPVNAVPYVCQAAPGILSATDLAPITPAGPASRAG